MPDRFKCIRFEFILINLQILSMCVIELVMASSSAATFYFSVLAYLIFIAYLSFKALLLIISAGVLSANFSCMLSCKLLYDKLRSYRVRLSEMASMISYIW